MSNVSRFFLLAITLWSPLSYSVFEDELHNAMYENNCDRALELIQAGASVNGSNPHITCNPLHIAARRGYIKMVRILLEHGADVNTKDFKGYTPLHGALGRIKTMTLLLKHGADPSLYNSYGETPLHDAVQRGLAQSVELLMSHDKALIHKTSSNHYGCYTPLHLAAIMKCSKMIERLIQHGALVDAQNGFHETPLHFAACLGNNKCMRLLLKHGACITAQNIHGMTVIHAVCKRPNRNIHAKQKIALLLGHARAQGKEDELLSLKDSFGNNTCDVARRSGDDYLIPLLTDFQKTNPLINKAAHKINISIALRKHKASNITQLIQNRELGIR